MRITITRLCLKSQFVGWVERSEAHRNFAATRWASLRSTHPTVLRQSLARSSLILKPSVRVRRVNDQLPIEKRLASQTQQNLRVGALIMRELSDNLHCGGTHDGRSKRQLDNLDSYLADAALDGRRSEARHFA